MQLSLFDLGRLWLALTLFILLGACRTEPTATPSTVSQAPPATPTSTMASPTETVQPSPTATPVPTATPSYTPTFETAACQFEAPAGRDVECGYVTVPEDRSNVDNGRTVRLHVAIFSGEGQDRPADPIVYLEGGPGGDALESAPLVFERRFAPFLANRDFIMFDQRGTGYSEPSLACPEYKEMSLDLLDEVLSPEAQTQAFLEAMEACHNRLAAEGIDLAAYDSAASAADVEDLRRALGYEQWNLYGISYGTRLALTVMRDYPGGVRSVVLDSAYPPEVNIVEETPVNFDRALDVFFNGCEAHAACNEAYPDLRDFFFDLVDEANAEPITVSIFHAFEQRRYEARLTGVDLLGVVFQGLYSEEIIPLLPQLIYHTAAGDYELLSALLSNFILNDEFVSIGMNFSVQCQEEVAFAEPADLAAAMADLPELEAYFRTSATSGSVAFATCELWDVPSAPSLEDEAVSSNLPTLILAGEYDPITPPVWGTEAQEDLPNSFYFSFPGLGHGVSVAGDCPRSVMLAFLDQPEREPQAACIADMGSPAFITPNGEDEEVQLTAFTADLFGTTLSGIAPEEWEEVSTGIFVRQRTALDQTALLQQAAPDVDSARFLDLLASQLGLETTPDVASTRQAGGRTWMLYKAEAQGVPVDIGLAEEEGVTYIVMLLSHTGERDELYEVVFLPALEAITVE